VLQSSLLNRHDGRRSSAIVTSVLSMAPATAPRALLSALAMFWVLWGQGVRADTPTEVRALYQQFVSAQNAGDLQKVRALLVDTADFLWVTDGMAVWGRDVAVERMSLFQKSEIWRVEPGLDQSRTVALGADAAIFHLPLVLVIGSSSPGPARLKFLVEVVCRKTPEGWRIAALLTTTDKSS
jgi:uncharacterized protein (TIGR02246 family)